jgi:6-phosphofructokinase
MRANHSNYSLGILSEGAEWQGYAVREYGEADAFGRRKKMSVAEDLSDEIKRATGEETVVSDLTSDQRSGSPDFVDRLVAFTFAGMAMDALEVGKSGLMTAINEGRYTMAPIPDPKLAPRKVDIASMYNTDRYRRSTTTRFTPDVPQYYCIRHSACIPVRNSAIVLKGVP